MEVELNIIIEKIKEEILDYADLLSSDKKDKSYYEGCIKSLNDLLRWLYEEEAELKKEEINKEVRKMKGQVCKLCFKPMKNSEHTFKVNDKIEFYVLSHCEQQVGCSNCVSMILRKVEGKCICGNTIQFNEKGDIYRILNKEVKK